MVVALVRLSPCGTLQGRARHAVPLVLSDEGKSSPAGATGPLPYGRPIGMRKAPYTATPTTSQTT